MSVGIDTVRALVEGYERAQEYEAALQEILLAGELGPDSRLPEHFDYTSAPFMHETARKALEGSRE